METRDVIFKNLTEEQINAIKVLLGDACDIEEQKEEKGEISFPKVGEKYYFLISDGEIDNKCFSPSSSVDTDRVSIGNCFRTEKEAKFTVERLKVLQKMKKFAEPETYAWNNMNVHYTFVYNTSTSKKDCLEIQGYYIFKVGSIHFKSREDAEACIEAVGEDRIKKYYLRIED